MVTTTGEGMPPLKEWVKHELEGYPAEVPIPDYRIFRAHNKGHFIGVTFQGELEIPVSVLPESLRPDFQHHN